LTFSILLFVGGLVLLYFGAEYLVSGSSRLARSYGVRPLIIGMTVVAFATSMPELTVSLLAAIRGSANIAVGNIIGSNVANLGLILGAASLVAPIPVARVTLKREIPFMIGASLLLYLLALDGQLGTIDGMALCGMLLLFLGYCLRTARAAPVEGVPTVPQPLAKKGERGRDLLWIFLGLVGLVVGADLMVRGAISIARALGVSDLVIGMSVVALGTSLPELAASLMSAWQGEVDIGIGNVIGSNIFNLLFVLGVCPLIRPLAVEPSTLAFELPVMVGFSVALLPLLILRPVLTRPKGGLLLAGYLLFVAKLFF